MVLIHRAFIYKDDAVIRSGSRSRSHEDDDMKDQDEDEVKEAAMIKNKKYLKGPLYDAKTDLCEIESVQRTVSPLRHAIHPHCPEAELKEGQRQMYQKKPNRAGARSFSVGMSMSTVKVDEGGGVVKGIILTLELFF